MLADQLPELQITAVEAQVVSFELLERNVRENNLSERYTLHCGDLRRLRPDPGSFDLVFGTPPFMPLGTGTLPQDAQRAAARFEMRGGIEAYCEAAAKALRDGGGCAIVMDAARPERYEAALQDAGLQLESVTSVVPMNQSPPTYLVYLATKTGTSDGAPTRTDLAIRVSPDQLTQEYEAIRVGLDLPTTRQLWL